jgi:xanthine dehydrogenase YagS FAD-binding subunit
MDGFSFARAADTADALKHVAAAGTSPPTWFAGGTTLLDLMKLDVMRPHALLEIGALRREHGAIEASEAGLRLGALVRMSEAADHPVLLRDYPVLAQALQLAASAQLRNMATLAGNVLQRTRCNYFRDPSWHACNKRNPGSGCSAIGGNSRHLAVLGVSPHCIAHYPGDFANALVALDATVTLLSPDGARRTLPVEALHRLPGDTPHLETVMQPGELIAGFEVPAGPWARRSLYLKVRDRASYAFALASAAVALHLEDGAVRTVRIGLGGLAAKPWRAHEAEAVLTGRPLDEASAQEAAEAAFAAAVTDPDNAFKPELGRRTLVRALLAARELEG